MLELENEREKNKVKCLLLKDGSDTTHTNHNVQPMESAHTIQINNITHPKSLFLHFVQFPLNNLLNVVTCSFLHLVMEAS